MLMRKTIELDNLTDEKTDESPRIPQNSTLLISLFPNHADIQIRKQSLKLAFFFVNMTTRQKNADQRCIITCAAIPYILYIKLKLNKCAI